MITEPGYYKRVNSLIPCEIIGPIPPSTMCAVIPAGWTVPKLIEFQDAFEHSEVIVFKAKGKRSKKVILKSDNPHFKPRTLPRPIWQVCKDVAKQQGRNPIIIWDRSRSNIRAIYLRWQIWDKLIERNPKVYTYSNIAKIFGYNHSTVWHGVRSLIEGKKPNGRNQ